MSRSSEMPLSMAIVLVSVDTFRSVSLHGSPLRVPYECQGSHCSLAAERACWGQMRQKTRHQLTRALYVNSCRLQQPPCSRVPRALVRSL